jgi:hypothetical protein
LARQNVQTAHLRHSWLRPSGLLIPNGQPTDLASNCGQGSTLRPMSASGRRARAAALTHPWSRSTERGGASQPVIKRDRPRGPHQACRPLHQLSRAFRTDSGSARQFVRGITAERNEVFLAHSTWLWASLRHALLLQRFLVIRFEASTPQHHCRNHAASRKVTKAAASLISSASPCNE